jgi:hypothetical protein
VDEGRAALEVGVLAPAQDAHAPRRTTCSSRRSSGTWNFVHELVPPSCSGARAPPGSTSCPDRRSRSAAAAARRAARSGSACAVQAQGQAAR